MRKLFLQYQLLTARFPILNLFIIPLLCFSPIIFGLIGAYFWEKHTGFTCHEGNCFWMQLGMFGAMFTVPFGFLWFLFAAADLCWVWRHNKKKKNDK